jgi:hypothetical protein
MQNEIDINAATEITRATTHSETRFSLLLVRKFTQKRNQDAGIAYIIKRATGGSRKSWNCLFTELPDSGEQNGEGLYLYKYRLDFIKTSGRKDDVALLQREREAIENIVDDACKLAKFAPAVWRFQRTDGPTIEEQQKASRTRHALSANVEVDREELAERLLEIINPILDGTTALSESEFFKHIFERDAQIRTLLSSVKSFLTSKGQRRNHVVLWGLPACAKTEILNAFSAMVGQAAITRFDGTSTTPAGIYKVYFEEYDEMQEPPFVILEEAEKTNEESLRVWLGMMDSRGELRKINARDMRQRNVEILCLATANDKEELDNALAGALSSRFAHQLYCQRPDEKVLRLILRRDIKAHGGKMEWIDPIIKLAQTLGTNDPRKVLSFLDGQDRLLDGSYQKDLIDLHKHQVGELRLMNREGVA